MNTAYQSLPSGEYYIGDPCYAIPDDEWDAYLEAAYEQLGQETDGGVFIFKGRKVYWHRTAFGDGSFVGYDDINDKHQEFGVDSGTLGLVPVELMGEKEKAEIEAHKLGVIEELIAPDVGYFDGEFTLGGYSIETDWDQMALDDEHEDFDILPVYEDDDGEVI